MQTPYSTANIITNYCIVLCPSCIAVCPRRVIHASLCGVHHAERLHLQVLHGQILWCFAICASANLQKSRPNLGLSLGERPEHIGLRSKHTLHDAPCESIQSKTQ